MSCVFCDIVSGKLKASVVARDGEAMAFLDARPLFTWTTANNPADPIHRGNCGPGRCAGMFDFLDITSSARDGSIWATAVDTCTGACVTGTAEADAMDGVAIRQTSGPSLWAKRKRN